MSVAQRAVFEFDGQDAVTARVQGELSFATAAEALAPGLRWIAAAQGDAVIDCAGLSRADSAGLAVLLEWLAAAERLKRSVTFSRLPESLRHLAEISEVESWLSPSPDRPAPDRPAPDRSGQDR